MKFDKKSYQKFAEAHAPRSPILKNCFHAFWTGGLICVLGQALRDLYTDVLKMSTEDAGTLTSVTLILLAALASGLGWFDRVAKLAGAGTLVPITGFANSVVSPAIDSHAEGLILGVGAKIFTVSGPVLLYGTLAGTLYGAIYWLIGLLF
ncbi:MAG: stage V sporulation protein AC [Clostridia bacterium]|nr:stage V sporulation protein AC [Clostridia bacterium]